VERRSRISPAFPTHTGLAIGWSDADQKVANGVSAELEDQRSVASLVVAIWPTNQPKPSADADEVKAISAKLLEGNDSKALAAMVRSRPDQVVSLAEMAAINVPRAAVAAALAVRPVYPRKLPTYRVRPIRLPWASSGLMRCSKHRARMQFERFGRPRVTREAVRLLARRERSGRGRRSGRGAGAGWAAGSRGPARPGFGDGDELPAHHAPHALLIRPSGGHAVGVGRRWRRSLLG
jgi:hypothetical protein